MSTPRGQQPSPYVTSPRSRSELSWGRVVARVLLVVVPGQLLGAVVASLVLPAEAVAAHPALGWLIYVFVAVVTGLGLGVVLRPTPERLVAFALVSAAVGVVVLTLLLLLGDARMTSGDRRSLVSDVFPGVPLTILLQTALALVLWRRRTGRRGGA